MAVKVRPRYVYAPQQKTEEMGAQVTWDGMLELFLKSKEKRTEKYVYDLRNSLTRAHHFLAGMGIVRPVSITKQAVKAFLVAYKAQGVSDVSVNHMAQKLMTEFTWAHDEDIFDSDKLATLKKIEISDKVAHVQVTIEEINLIINAIYESWSIENAPASRFRSDEAREFFTVRDVCMTLWMAETGSRVGETTRLLRADLNLEKRSALLRDTKNEDDRAVYYTEGLHDAILADWIRIRDGLETLCDNLFVSELGLPLNPYRWGRQWNVYRQKAGIKRRIRRHDLRHFSSTEHDLVSIKLSKLLIGHRTDSAHAVYSHPSESVLRAAHDQADPIRAINDRLTEERFAKNAAAEAEVAPTPRRKRVYTK